VRLPSINLRGVRLHAVTEAQCVRHVLDELDAGRGGVVVTPNLDHLRRCVFDVSFGALVSEADMVVADGMPLVWASKLQGTPLPERVAGSNLISSLSGAAAERGKSVFLLGGAPGTADAAARVLKERFPGLIVAGTCCPSHGFEDDQRAMSDLQQRLAACGADIVYVALGSPKQERLISRLKVVLPRAWWLGVGNSFSFLSGHVKRAPLWMQRMGVEWLHRLCQEPRRLFKRYIVSGLPFGSSLMLRSVGHGVIHRLHRRRLAAAGLAAPESAPGNASEANGDGRTSRTLGAGTNGDGAVLLDPVRDPPNGQPKPLSADDSALGIVLAANAAASNDSRVGGASRLSRLRAVVLLGGSVRPSPLAQATGRSVLDLPLERSTTLINFWLAQAKDIAELAGLDPGRLPVRVMVSQNSPEPESAEERFFGTFRIERDRSEYRGTGGVLRDVGSEYDDDDLILVANAAQILLDPLAAVAAALDRKGGDVGLVSHDDGTPSGIMLLSCKALRLAPVTGFADMKEQVLPLIASRFDVRVLRRRRPTGLPVRTLEDYIQALRFHHLRRAGKPVMNDPLAEDWSAAFSLVEAGATVDPTARVHDSVVLSGSAVEPGAVLVRSVVCPGAVVRRDKTAVDQFVLPIGKSRITPAQPTGGADGRLSPPLAAAAVAAAAAIVP
jgi:N-acetylglucosaminyldiphosphoundecaprenol N-acetyl-beta-D-mannosaminyltransferase